MRSAKYSNYPLLRRTYANLEELAQVINRNRITVFRKLAYDEFTKRDKELIAQDLRKRGEEGNTQELIIKYFGG